MRLLFVGEGHVLLTPLPIALLRLGEEAQFPSSPLRARRRPTGVRIDPHEALMAGSTSYLHGFELVPHSVSAYPAGSQWCGRERPD
jgi:hypothetical protein